MATEATAGWPAAPSAQPAAWRPRIARAGRVVTAAGAIGVAGQLLFFEVGLGLNFPIAIGLLLLGGWLVRRRTPRLLGPDGWLAPAALGFAAFAAVRADPTIVALDLLTSLGLAGASLAAFGGARVIERPISGLIRIGLRAIGWAFAGAVPAIAAARNRLPSSGAITRRGRPAMPVLRGMAIAVPIVLVFIALFSSADAVFAQIVDDLFGLDLDLGDIQGRIVMAAALGWLAAGGLAMAAAEQRDLTPTVPSPTSWRVGTTEAITILVAIEAVFLLFVGLQAAYLFGGLDTLQATGLTYADYARRGFFELVAVAVLAGGIVIGLERLSRDRTRLLLGAAIGLVLLTGVVLASAALRLRLYQEAFGWTELRLYVLATIVLLGVGAITLLVQLVTDRVRWLGHVLIATALAIGLGLNLIGPVRFITEQNVARVLDSTLVPLNGRSGIDDVYVLSLGDDAIPALVGVLPELDGTEARIMAEALRLRRDELRSDPGVDAWQAWNAGRAVARDALEGAAAAGDLP